MSDPEVPKPRLWPRVAVGPLGNRAMFDCIGDVPVKWKLEVPLEPAMAPETYADLMARDLEQMRHEYFGCIGKDADPEWSANEIRHQLNAQEAVPKRGPGRPPKAKP